MVKQIPNPNKVHVPKLPEHCTCKESYRNGSKFKIIADDVARCIYCHQDWNAGLWIE